MIPQKTLLLVSAWVAVVGVSNAMADDLPPGPWNNPPALPAPKGKVIKVKAGDAEDLVARTREAGSDTTILVPKGEYRLSSPMRIGIQGAVKNVVLRGETGRRDDVVIRGPGMKVDSKDSVPHCLMIENATDVMVADLSIGDVWLHPITCQAAAGVQRPHIRNVRLFDAGEQFLKVNSPGDFPKRGCDGGIVEYCVFEYTDTARHWYTEGVDVHRGDNWIVRDNLFRNIRGPAGAENIGGAIDFWNNSRKPLIERNVILDCAVGIRVGINDKKGFNDCEGAIVRNNLVARRKGSCHWQDVGILVADCPDAQVLHNTVYLDGTYAHPIEFRFPATQNIVIRGNVLDGNIRQREGADGKVSDNLTKAEADWFEDIFKGDGHLVRRSPPVGAVKKPMDGVTDDIDGHERPSLGKQDAGCDHQGSSARR